MANVFPIKAFSDNYIWIIQSDTGPEIAVVDPGDAAPVIALIEDQGLKLTSILITHHHWDHTGGIAQLRQHYADIVVYGPAHDGIDTITHPLTEADRIYLDAQKLEFNILDIPGHTLGHIAYHNDTMLFSGDTLFACGCGRVFEGTQQQMYDSLEKLKNLSDTLNLYCGHEYTLNNLTFALAVEPNHPALTQRFSKVQSLIKAGQPSLPCTLKEEKLTNPFFRCDDQALAKACLNQNPQVDPSSPVSVFTALRQWKDNF